MQVEAQFSTANIVQEKTKFNHVLAALDSDVAELISDFLFQPQTLQPYTDLMHRLQVEFEESDGRKVNKLLYLNSIEVTANHLIYSLKYSQIFLELRFFSHCQIMCEQF